MTNLKLRDMTCKVCGKVFPSSRIDAKYCSGKCRMKILRGMKTPLAKAALAGAAFLANQSPKPPPLYTPAADPPAVTDTRSRTRHKTKAARTSGPKPKVKAKPSTKAKGGRKGARS